MISDEETVAIIITFVNYATLSLPGFSSEDRGEKLKRIKKKVMLKSG